MNPKIKALRDGLNEDAAEIVEFFRKEGLAGAADGWAERMRLTASILQAVFDPENQPSQYGTTLAPK